MKYRILIHIIVFIYSLAPAFSQTTEEADSLLENYYTILPDNAEKVNLLYKKGSELRLKDMPLAFRYADECLKTALVVKKPLSLVKAYTLLGTLNFRENKNPEALNYHEKAEEIANKLGDSAVIANVLENKANVYEALADNIKAESLYLKALQLHNKAGNRVNAGKIIANLGVMKFKAGDYELARIYFEKALKEGEDLNDYESRMAATLNLGRVYESQEKYEEALHFYEDATEIAYLMDSDPEVADGLINQAAALIALGKTQNSKECLKEALKLSQKHNYSDGIIDCYDLLSQAWKNERIYDSAFHYQQLFFEEKEKLQNKLLEERKNAKIVVRDDTAIFKLSEEIYVLKYVIAVLSVFLLILLIFIARKTQQHEQREE